MKKVVVTGGGGFIGSGIVRTLIEKGDQVTVVGRSEYPALVELGAVCLKGDVTDQSFMDAACRETDIVYHTVAKTSVYGEWQDFVRTNVGGTSTVLKSCVRNNVAALVYTSTPSVIASSGDLEGVDETMAYPDRIPSKYAASKIIAEKLVLNANSSRLKTIAIRPHLVWGPGDPHIIPRLLERARSGRLKQIGSGKNKVDICYIDNAVHAHLLAADNLMGEGTGAGRAFFIAQDEPVVLWDWINELLTLMNIEQVQKKIPPKAAYWLGALLEAYYWVTCKEDEPELTRFVALQMANSHWFSHQAAEEILGYKQVVSTAEGLQKVADARP